MKTVYNCLYQEDALVLKSMLESAGIPAELLSGGKLDVNPLFNTEVHGFSLRVPDDYAEDAMSIAADYKAGGRQTEDRNDE